MEEGGTDLIRSADEEDDDDPEVGEEGEDGRGAEDLHPVDHLHLALGDSHHAHRDDDEQVEGRRAHDRTCARASVYSSSLQAQLENSVNLEAFHDDDL